jgi:hypothetical protein
MNAEAWARIWAHLTKLPHRNQSTQDQFSGTYPSLLSSSETPVSKGFLSVITATISFVQPQNTWNQFSA